MDAVDLSNVCLFACLFVCFVWKPLSVFSNSVFIFRLHTCTHINISWQSIQLHDIFICNNENILSVTSNLNCFSANVISCFLLFTSKRYEYQYYHSQINRFIVTLSLLRNREHHTNIPIHTYHSSNMAYITRAHK